MKKQIMIDRVNHRICLSRDFERRAANAESEEYALLQSVVSQYPKDTLHSGVIRKKENKEAYKGLTYGYMEDYMFDATDAMNGRVQEIILNIYDWFCGNNNKNIK